MKYQRTRRRITKIKPGPRSRSSKLAFLAAASLLLSPSTSHQASDSIHQEIYSQSSSNTLEGRVVARENVNYTELADYAGEVESQDRHTRDRFLLSMQNLEKYELEPLIDLFCDSFGIKEEEVIPYLINESNLNPNAKTTGGCKGIGQMSKGATQSANTYFKKRWGVDLKLKYGGNKRDQIKSSLAYFAKTYTMLKEKYPGLGREDLLSLVYFSYNAGNGPVNLAVTRLQRKGEDIVWGNVENEITPQLLRASSSKEYAQWSDSSLKRKVRIIKDYVKHARIYNGCLHQLPQIAAEKRDYAIKYSKAS